MQMGAHAVTTEWTDEETLKLLTYYDAYGDEWERLAQYLENKTPLDCLAKFLSLDFETESKENQDVTEQLLDALSHAENPVMMLLHLLASAVSPGFASDVARSVLSFLLEHQPLDTPHAPVHHMDELMKIAVHVVMSKMNKQVKEESNRILELVDKLGALELQLCHRKLSLLKSL